MRDTCRYCGSALLLGGSDLCFPCMEWIEQRQIESEQASGDKGLDVVAGRIVHGEREPAERIWWIG